LGQVQQFNKLALIRQRSNKHGANVRRQLSGQGSGTILPPVSGKVAPIGILTGRARGLALGLILSSRVLPPPCRLIGACLMISSRMPGNAPSIIRLNRACVVFPGTLPLGLPLSAFLNINLFFLSSFRFARHLEMLTRR
jgi:hypothetical protein